MSNTATKQAKVAPRTSGRCGVGGGGGESRHVLLVLPMLTPRPPPRRLASLCRSTSLNSLPPHPPAAADEELKWLSWPEFLQLCGVLRRECAALDVTGKRRSDAAVSAAAGPLAPPAARALRGTDHALMPHTYHRAWPAAGGLVPAAIPHLCHLLLRA